MIYGHVDLDDLVVEAALFGPCVHDVLELQTAQSMYRMLSQTLVNHTSSS